MSGMGGAHSHRTDGPAVEVDRVPRTVLLGSLALAAVVTLVGLVLLWPDASQAEAIQDSLSFTAEGTTFVDGSVLEAEPACAEGEEAGCGRLRVQVAEGPDAGTRVDVNVPPQVSDSGLRAGDTVELLRTEPQEGTDATYSYFATDRGRPMLLLLGAFVLVVLLVARLRGLLALLGLGFAALVVVQFMLPALLVGESGVLVAVVGSSAIMLVVLYTTHGFSLRTSAALAGTLVGVALTAVLGVLSVHATRLSGVADEGGGVLLANVDGLSFQGLLSCAIVIAGLGVLNDVTITQASAVWEIRGAAPELSRRRVFASAMRIGRDHIASTIYTIVFAYAGTALTLLLVLQLYDRPVLDLLNTEEIAGEVVRTLATSIGLVLAVPLTTVIAVLTLPRGASPAHSTPEARVTD